MIKKRLAVAILMLAISSNLVACKSDTDKQEAIDTTQTSSNEIQGDILSTGGNFTKLLVSLNNGTSTDSSSDSKNEENLGGAESTESTNTPDQNSRPPIGLAVIDSKDRVDIEEEKVVGTVDYDIVGIADFNDFGEVEQVSELSNLTDSTQAVLTKFDMENWPQIIGYLTDVCTRYHVDIGTVEATRGLKVDKSLAYNVIVAYNDKYDIYIAINKEDFTAKYRVEEK